MLELPLIADHRFTQSDAAIGERLAELRHCSLDGSANRRVGRKDLKLCLLVLYRQRYAQRAELLRMEEEGDLTSGQVKQVLAEMAASHRPPAVIVAELGLEAVDTSELATMVDDLIAAHPEEWERFCGGESKMQGFFVGQVMRQTSGQADGKTVNQLLVQKRG